ncbi:MAG: hypothetical protein MRZ79_18260 [Bacteroidia bacterium]|nr:hypothetical protein [Bacteroidia bacterium]
MNITLEETGKLTADLKVLVHADDYKEQVKSELKKQAKKASIPGFRPGKVPVQVVRNMVGLSVVIDELNKIVAESVQKYIEEENLDLLGDPLPKNLKTEADYDPKAEKDMEFVFEVGMAPSFEVDLELPKLPEMYQVEIDEKFLEKEFNLYQEHFGETSTPEEFEKGDIVFGRAYEVDENGEELEGGFSQMFPLNPKRIEKDKVFKKFKGAKLEDSFDFNIKDVSKDKDELKRILFLEEDAIEALLEKNVKYQIKRLNRVAPAEVNEEFLKKVADNQKLEFGEEEEITEDGVKAKMSESLEKSLNDIAKTRFKNKLSESLIEHHVLEYPDEFLKKWLKATNKESTEESIESEYPKFSKDLTYTLIESQLIKKYDIKVEEDEVNETLKNTLTQNIMQSGQPVDENMLESYMQYAKQDQNTMNRIFRTALTNNVLNKLVDEFNPELTLIKASEFVELK